MGCDEVGRGGAVERGGVQSQCPIPVAATAGEAVRKSALICILGKNLITFRSFRNAGCLRISLI